MLATEVVILLAIAFALLMAVYELLVQRDLAISFGITLVFGLIAFAAASQLVNDDRFSLVLVILFVPVLCTQAGVALQLGFDRRLER